MEAQPYNFPARSHRSRGSDATFDQMDARSSRAPSISSDRPSVLSPHGYSTLKFVHPPPGYVAVAAASQMVTDTNNAILRDRFDLRDTSPSPIGETALFSEDALALLNAFLDYILYRVLGAARGPGLARLRGAFVEVLKPRLARDAMAIAEEELRDLMSEEEEEDEESGGRRAIDDMLDDADREVPERWDLDGTFKRTRLRVMVYTRLGEMEDEDEERYLDLDNADILSGLGLVSGASAIFLTSIIEYLAERILAIAGAAAYNRVLGKRRVSTARSPAVAESAAPQPQPEMRPPRIVVEDRDLEKVALNSTLGRLYRTWRQRTRQDSSVHSSIHSPLHHSATYAHLTLPMSPASSTAEAVDGGSLARQDSNVSEHVNENLPEHEPSETEIAANIPLPEGEDDVREIEIPGLAKEITDDEDAKEDERSDAPTPISRPTRPHSFFLPMARLLGLDDDMDRPEVQRQRSSSVPALERRSLFEETDDGREEFMTPTEELFRGDNVDGQEGAAKVVAKTEEDDDGSTDEEAEDAYRITSDDEAEPVVMNIKRVSIGVPPSPPAVVDTPRHSGSIRSKKSRDTSTPDISEFPDEVAEDIAYPGPPAPASAGLGSTRTSEESPLGHARPQGLAIDSTPTLPLDDPEAIGVARTTDIPTPASASPKAEQGFSKTKQKADSIADRARMRASVSPPIPRSVPSPNENSATTAAPLATAEENSVIATASRNTDSPEFPARSAASAAGSRFTGPDAAENAIPSEGGRGARTDSPSDRPLHAPPQPGPRSQRAISSGSGSSGTTGTTLRIVTPLHVVGGEQKPAVPSRSSDRASQNPSHSQQAPTALVSSRDGTTATRSASQALRDMPSTPTGQTRNSPPNMGPATAWAPTSAPSPRNFRESPRRSADTAPSGRGSSASAGSTRPRAPSIQTAINESPQHRPASSTPSGRRSGSIHTTTTPTLHKTNGSDTSFGLLKGSLDPRQSTEARARDFDALVAGEDTVKFKLVSPAMQDIESLPPRGPTNAPAAVPPRPSSKASVGKAPVSSPSPDPSSTSSSKSRGPVPVSRPAPPSSSSSTKAGLLAREPRIQSESMRDFADFIRSTGPYGEQIVQPLVDPSALPRHSMKAARSPQPSTFSANRSTFGSTSASNSSLGLSRSQSDATATSVPTRRKPHLEARSAAVASNDGSSDLIDFIRQGPPAANGEGRHRIPRAVAPFRTTMDSDDLGQLEATGGFASPHTSMASTVNSRFSAAPSHGSAAPLLPSARSSLQSRGNPPYKSSLASSPAQSAPSPKATLAPPGGSGFPPRTRRRIKDPYAIDFSDEEEDDDDGELLINPSSKRPPPRKEESLADFLRSAEPPAGNAPSALSPRAGVPSSRGAGQGGVIPGPSREEGGRMIGMMGRSKVAAKDARAGRQSSTNELADFLRNSGPPVERKGDGGAAAKVEKKDREKTSFWKRGKLRG
ncbi:hypothetical protein P152DRAFT_286995 [Eremomyces bilateralis CBS 781.70]|uniref:Uncharacterized protein n=1 Tax=Eremomyces bilateralis CBS 781.70 TaxID=1392243 RepID=A0A6G1G6F5_9PEZI|nr:uncharacterized protein P152DRAFT_286995 [Eremomyces bilateralis CBS 781.70]KAF1813633.1 hypothetical protein P152DRAFT_286995 [Eremomyces bilateralis CBS 781.70]